MLTLSFVAIALAGPSSASTVCVDPNDTSCEKTIEEGIAAANPGDTIEIKEGFYEESVEVTERDVTLEGESGVVIQSPDPERPGILVMKPDVKLKALEVRGAMFQPAILMPAPAILIEKGATDVTIDNVTVVDVEDIPLADVETENCIKTHADRTMVKHSRVEACGSACIQAGDPDDPGGPIDLTRRANGLTVRDTKIKACKREGILVYGTDATIEASGIARTGNSCVAVFGDEASIYDSQATNCYLCGFCIIGDGGTVDRSRANTTLEDGICGIGQGAKFTRNRTEDTLLSGIFWEGQAHIEKNEIKGAGFHGMDLWGQDFKVRYNEVEDAGGDTSTDCYLIGADDSWIRSNEAEDCPDDGFDIAGSENQIENNDTESIIDNGFEVTGDENTLVVNEATDSGSFDLCDEGIDTDLSGNESGLDTRADADCAD